MPINSSARRWWLAGLCCAVYALLWVGWVRDWGWLVSADTSMLAAGWRVGADHPAWVTFWDVWCTVFSPVVIRIATVGLIVYALRQRQVRTAVFLVVCVEMAAVLTELLKRLADRPRPATAMVDALSTSFPSGHALGTMAAALALGVVCLPKLRPNLRPWAVAATVVVVLTVGAGRVALNVHHPSDVVAGWAMGYVYFVLCLLILRGDRTGVTEADETPAMPGSAR
ncbi:phosphatase PAP2 family protein [Mycobacterium hodleri]|uniref:phosphatase PAP2 family protein n=1 Tax=Mycolicibacterium hodleri TaxID=49897 RepID=UPI0021F36502|nr:phosphatase PAP2 family protein [Mycolicibacterium hodleri]MCV7136952.1 phosphatase PAP2 family protein [Mycolicibacterium hodleri]